MLAQRNISSLQGHVANNVVFIVFSLVSIQVLSRIQFSKHCFHLKTADKRVYTRILLKTAFHKVLLYNVNNHSSQTSNIRIYHECEGGIEKSARKSPFGMPNGDSQGRFFYPILIQMMDCFSCSPSKTEAEMLHARMTSL